MPCIKGWIAYCIVELRNPSIRDGQARQKDKIDQSVDVALLGKITCK